MINLYYMHPTTDKVTNKHELTIYVVTWEE